MGKWPRVRAGAGLGRASIGVSGPPSKEIPSSGGLTLYGAQGVEEISDAETDVEASVGGGEAIPGVPRGDPEVIYTTNAIESVNSQFRRSVQNRGHFPTERSALKVLYVTVKQMEKKWTKPVQNWSYMFQQFVIHFPDRMPV